MDLAYRRRKTIASSFCFICLNHCSGHPATLVGDGVASLLDSGASVDGSPDTPEGAALPSGVRLDLSFGINGNLGGELATWIPVGVAIDDRGRLLVSGPGGQKGAAPVETVFRFTADGAFDTTFGTAGSVTLSVKSDRLQQTLRSLPDGRIGVLGAAGSEQAQAAAFGARLGSDGTPDPTFAGQTLPQSCESFSSGLWQDDGSGFVFGASAAIRFGSGGTPEISYAGAAVSSATTGLIGPEGQLWTGAGTRIARYLASGTLDPAFGQAGSVDLTGESPDGFSLRSLLSEGDGKVFAVGSHPSGGAYAVDVIRMMGSGEVDSAYAGRGIASVPANGGPVGAAVLAGGRLLVWTSYGDLLALGPGGGSQGTWDLQVFGTVLSAAVDANQRLVVVGIATTDPLHEEWFVRRYVLY